MYRGEIVKVIIAGSRTINAYDIVPHAVEASKFQITEIISGGAAGVDAAGEFYAKFMGIPLKVFPADWTKHGKAAGPIRNQQMAEYADALICIWDGKSKGSESMIREARKRNLKVYVHEVKV
jgi:hypothetical protein